MNRFRQLSFKAAVLLALLPGSFLPEIRMSGTAHADTIDVPSGQPSIQAGVNAASQGDTVLVAPGEYFERITLSGKSVTLASWFLTTGNPEYVTQTIIDGGGRTVVRIEDTVGPGTAIIGFTIQNGDDGISPNASFQLLNNRIVNCGDGVDYGAGSGGVCRNNVFENNGDDGIDLDYDVDIVIEDNTVRNNGDDGIEIRLHEYSGPLLSYIIRRNLIYGNTEDGIQIIDYPDTSNRVFHIERNVIYANAMVGLGCMADGNTYENYEGAGIPEPIYVMNNTFANNDHGITGGDHLIAVNNIIANSARTAVKNTDGNSIVSFSLLWGNGADFDNCNTDEANIFRANPFLDEQFRPTGQCPGINTGTATFVWQGNTVLDLSAEDYVGSAPDIGAFELSLPVPDFNGDGTVDFTDFVRFAQHFGKRQGDAEYDATFDLDLDSSIDFADFIRFAQAFGKPASRH